MPRRASALLIGLLAACAPAASVAPVPPPPLAYRAGAPTVVDYVVGDTSRVEIRAAGQAFTVTAAALERWRMELAPAGELIRVTATLTEFQAAMTNPLTAPQELREPPLDGPIVFTLDPRGRSTIERMPEMAPVAAQFLSGPQISQLFFPRLPGRAVTTGDVWVDTVAYAVDEAGVNLTATNVTTYTVVGDTLAAGASYLLVRTAGTSAQSMSGAMAGTELQQSVTGTTAGHFLWDVAAGVLHALEYRSDLSGTMEVTVAPVPLAIRVLGTARITRVPAG